MKEKVDIVFVVLTYANIQDVSDFIHSVERVHAKCKIVIINSFYDNETLNKCKTIALEKGCEFISVENKGYSAGNNRGIEYANANYDYRFLIVSNPDIIIKKLDIRVLEKFENDVIGPNIITSTGKRQNPFYIDKKIFPKQEYIFLKRKNKVGYYSIVAINKIKKYFFFARKELNKRESEKVYALHGSFIIFSKHSIELLGAPFDENMFLFGEEVVLAEEMKRKNINAIYTSAIEVYHKEDGSMKFLNGSMYDEEVKSNSYVYNKYFK